MALMTAQEYIESLRKLKTRVYMFGEDRAIGRAASAVRA